MKQKEEDVVQSVRKLISDSTGSDEVFDWLYKTDVVRATSRTGHFWWEVSLYQTERDKKLDKPTYYAQIVDGRPDIYVILDKQLGRPLKTTVLDD